MKTLTATAIPSFPTSTNLRPRHLRSQSSFRRPHQALLRRFADSLIPHALCTEQHLKMPENARSGRCTAARARRGPIFLFADAEHNDTASLHQSYGSCVLASHEQPALFVSLRPKDHAQLHQGGLAHDAQDTKLKVASDTI